MPAELDRTLAALADPARRAIVDLLRKQSRRPSEVAARLGLTRPATSRHLRVLRDAGMIDDKLADDDARARVLELRREPFTQMREWVDEVEAFWGDQLASFKAHAERKSAKRRR